MRKRQLVILTLTSLVSVVAVHAQRRPLLDMPDVISNAIKFLFVDIMNMSSTDVGAAYMKMILWLILSTFIYLGLNKSGMFGTRAGLLGFISALISLVGVILIPSKLILTIFTMHSSIVALTAGLAPVGVGFWVNRRILTGNDTFSRVFRIVIYVAMAMVTWALITVISEI